jgi:hypothetical protein
MEREQTKKYTHIAYRDIRCKEKVEVYLQAITARK